MPSALHKFEIRKEIVDFLPPDVLLLMCGDGQPLDALYSLIGNVAGAIQLAYERGRLAGKREAATSQVTEPEE